MFNWLKRKKVEEKVQPVAQDLEFKNWAAFSPEELQGIANMLSDHSYGDVILNMNDIFAPAAWSVEAYQYDLPALAELHKEFGRDGVVAWCAVKEGVDKTFKGSYPRMKEAMKKIEADPVKYYWEKRYQIKKERENGTKN